MLPASLFCLPVSWVLQSKRDTLLWEINIQITSKVRQSHRYIYIYSITVCLRWREGGSVFFTVLWEGSLQEPQVKADSHTVASTFWQRWRSPSIVRWSTADGLYLCWLNVTALIHCQAAGQWACGRSVTACACVCVCVCVCLSSCVHLCVLERGEAVSNAVIPDWTVTRLQLRESLTLSFLQCRWMCVCVCVSRKWGMWTDRLEGGQEVMVCKHPPLLHHQPSGAVMAVTAQITEHWSEGHRINFFSRFTVCVFYVQKGQLGLTTC